jgi:hypothetical protein
VAIVDVAGMIGMGRVDKTNAVFRREIFSGARVPVHCQGFLADGSSRVEDRDMAVKV